MRRLLKDQSGIALVMSLGMIAVLSIVGTTTLVYTTSNARSGVLSKDNERAFSLAEAGLNNAMAVLSLPTNNALDPDVLPSTGKLANLRLSLPVNLKPSETGKTWRLVADIVLRNTTRL